MMHEAMSDSMGALETLLPGSTGLALSVTHADRAFVGHRHPGMEGFHCVPRITFFTSVSQLVHLMNVPVLITLPV